ncbi:MAG: hypothetical protein QS721_15195 [Candidatus Endonucleobacter sp. (ex Gigantidas childressi)]|nr:hypothetical protein [Candidatus Endonucleobacter sp. (ex Gigantidas childressi)]
MHELSLVDDEVNKGTLSRGYKQISVDEVLPKKVENPLPKRKNRLKKK